MRDGADMDTFIAKLRTTVHPCMELDLPLYAVRECDIVRCAQDNDLHFLNCACRFTERVANKEEESKRREMKELLAHMERSNPEAANNIFRSMHNVALDCIVGWRREGKRGSFLDEY